jgi:hypothetical protein
MSADMRRMMTQKGPQNYPRAVAVFLFYPSAKLGGAVIVSIP